MQLCQAIHSGDLVRRGARAKCLPSANLIQDCPALYDWGEFVTAEAVTKTQVEYQIKIAGLQRKVAQLKRALHLIEKSTFGPSRPQQRQCIHNPCSACFPGRHVCEVTGLSQPTRFWASSLAPSTNIPTTSPSGRGGPQSWRSQSRQPTRHTKIASSRSSSNCSPKAKRGTGFI